MKNLLYFILFISVFSYSQEEKRLALVIGNSEYINGPLKNPVNDAKLIAKALDSLGFEVLEYYNLTTQRQLKKAILEFGAKRDSANVGFVYYAGHGVQVNNENYLLPTQEEYTSQTEVIEYAVSVQTVLRALKSDSNQVNILVLDACRDNPYESNWSQTRSAQGGTGGLAKIPPPNGSIIAFSTSAGETAADGKGINSDYTLSLYKNILLEDTSLDQVFRNVRAEVFKITNGAQRPIEMTQLTGQTFYLNPGNYDEEFKAIELILEQKKELLDALNILAPIIDDMPENIRALELLAESYVALENFSKALETLDILVGLDTKKSIYLRQRAWCYKKLDNLEKALEDYNKAVEVEPENSYNYEMRGDFYENYLKDYDKALADYNKGIELNPTDAELHFSKAYLYDYSLDNPDLALQSYLEVVRLNPDYQGANNNIALLYISYVKDYQKALEFYTKEIELDPSDALAYRNRARLYVIQLEDLEKALEDYNKAVEVEPENSYNYEMRGDFYENYLKDYDKALADYNKGIELNPTDADLHFIKAYLYASLDKLDLALQSYLEVVRLNPEYQNANNNIALLYISYVKDYQKALEFYTKEIELHPSEALAYRNRARLYVIQLEDLEKALEDYNKAVEVEPENSYNYDMRGDFYRDYLKDYDKALADYNKGIELNPTDAGLHFSKAYLYDDSLDNPDLALQSYLEVVRLNPEYQNANNNIALLYISYVKDYQKALEFYTKEIELDPSDALAYTNRAELYANQLEDLEKALEDYNKAVEVEPENSYNYEMRGDFYENYLKDYDKALADYNKGIELNPTDADLHFIKAYLYASLDKLDLALQSYLEVVRLNPEYQNANNNIALLYISYVKDYQKALEFYTKEIELDPSDALAYTNRAKLYANQLEDLEKALEDYNKAVEVEPENSYNYDMRGIFYGDYLKDYDKALADYNKGIELNPTDPGLHFSKAYLYDDSLDNPDLALQSYLEVVRLDPEKATSYVKIARIMRFKKDFNNSVDYYTKAIALDTTYTIGYIWRGIVLQHDLKKPNLALKDYNKAIEVNSESYSGLLYRAKLYLELNEFEKAKLDISSAIKLDDKDSEAFYVLAQLHKLQGNKLDNYLALSDAIKFFENSYINNFNATGSIALESLLIERGSISQSFGQLDNACKDYSTALKLAKLESEIRKEIEQLISENCNN